MGLPQTLLRILLVALVILASSSSSAAGGDDDLREPTYANIGIVEGSDGPVGQIGDPMDHVFKPGKDNWELDSEAWFDAGAALLKSATDQYWGIYSLGARALMLSLRLDPTTPLAAFSHSNIAYAVQRLRENAGGHWRWKAWCHMMSYVRKDGSESAYEALAWVHVQNDDALGAERAYLSGLEKLCKPPLSKTVPPGGSRICAVTPAFWYKWWDALQMGANLDMWMPALKEVLEVVNHELAQGGAVGMTMAQAMRVPLKDDIRKDIASSHYLTMRARLGDAYRLPVANLAPLAGRRVRVGYLSFNFSPSRNLNGLASGMFAAGMHALAGADPYCFAIYGHHRRDTDAERAHAQEGCAWVDLGGDVGGSDAELAMRVNQYRPDVLVDLVGLIANNRHGIAMHRPAPSQIVMIYAATTGGDGADHMVADRTVLPPELARAVVTECAMLFPASLSHFVNNQRGLLPAPPASPPPRSQIGVPLTGELMCGMNAFFKIDPAVFQAWMSVLRGGAESASLLLARYQYHEASSPRLHKAASLYGVPPERLVVLAKTGSVAEHIERMMACRAFLDTRIYNAHTLAVDALWAGIPLITYPGTSFASRVSASLLLPSGLGGLIMRSWDDYVATGTRFASGASGVFAERARRLSSAGRVFDGAAWMCAYGKGVRMAADLAEASGAGRRQHMVVAEGGCKAPAV